MPNNTCKHGRLNDSIILCELEIVRGKMIYGKEKEVHCYFPKSQQICRLYTRRKNASKNHKS